MRNVGIIASREFMSLIRTKAFLISVFITPFMIAGIMALPNIMEGRGAPPVTVLVADRSGEILTPLTEAIAAQSEQEQRNMTLESAPEPEGGHTDESLKELKSKVLAGEYYALFVVPENIYEEGAFCEYHTTHATDTDPQRRLTRVVNDLVIEERFYRHNLDSKLIDALQRKVFTQTVDLTAREGAEVHPLTRFLVPFVFSYVLFLGSVISGQMLLTSTIEEKSSRIVEVILSSATASQIMIGKILGIGAVSLSLIALYGGGAFGAAWHADLLNNVTLTPMLVVWFIAFYIVGYMTIASIYTAVGAACNELKEAQSMIMPLTMFMVIPIALSPTMIKHPDAPLAVVLSYLPPFSPFVMVLRIGADPTLQAYEPLVALGIMAVFCMFTWWAAAKIFRVGILMYGKPPRLADLFKWLKA